MRSGLATILVSFGTIFLSFGLVFFVIGFLGARHGSPHEMAGPLALGLLVTGAILAGAGVLLRRSA